MGIEGRIHYVDHRPRIVKTLEKILYLDRPKPRFDWSSPEGIKRVEKKIHENERIREKSKDSKLRFP